MWLVSWDVIYHKSTPSKTSFFSLSLLQENTSTSGPILFSTCVKAFTIFIFMNYLLLNVGQRVINLTSVLLRFCSTVFLESLKILHMLFRHRNVPEIRNEMFLWGNKVPPKWDPGFIKVRSLLDGRIFFHTNRFWFFNRILIKMRSHLTEPTLLGCSFRI